MTTVIKYPRFVGAVLRWQYAVDLLHWSKSWIALTSLWSVFFDGDVKMDTILDMTKVFLSSVCFCLFPIDVACDNICFFFSCQVITLAYRFGEMVPVTAKMGVISPWFSAMDNALLCASGLSLEDKIEERIYFALCHARLYLTVSYDDWDEKSAAANTFDISCGGGVSISSLPAINVYVLATSDVVGCWIFPSAWFLSNDPPSIDDMVDWENDSILGIGRGETNVDEGSFVLHNSW